MLDNFFDWEEEQITFYLLVLAYYSEISVAL